MLRRDVPPTEYQDSIREVVVRDTGVVARAWRTGRPEVRPDVRARIERPRFVRRWPVDAEEDDSISPVVIRHGGRAHVTWRRRSGRVEVRPLIHNRVIGPCVVHVALARKED